MVYLLLADGFEEVEALEPTDILRRGGVDVKTVGICDKRVTGSHNITVEADISIDDVSAEGMEALILPGGPGHTLIEQNEKAKELIMKAASDSILAAICASPSIIGKMGLLEGKKATCFPGYEECLKGAALTREKAVKDGNIITARGAGAASEFGFLILAALKGRETADKIKEVMQY